MENLPQNVINKIMFFTSHPVAEILRESSIFRALEFDNGKRIRTHTEAPSTGETWTPIMDEAMNRTKWRHT